MFIARPDRRDLRRGIFAREPHGRRRPARRPTGLRSSTRTAAARRADRNDRNDERARARRRVARRGAPPRRAKEAGSALVIPPAPRRLATGEPARMLLYTDPVKSRAAQRAPRAPRGARRSRPARAWRARPAAPPPPRAGRIARRRARSPCAACDDAERDARRARSSPRARQTRVRADVAHQIDWQTNACSRSSTARSPARAAALQAPARLSRALADAPRKAWFAELQRLAARRADDIAPPEFPEPPPELVRAR